MMLQKRKRRNWAVFQAWERGGGGERGEEGKAEEEECDAEEEMQ
jgi:hypothetical protein